MRGMDLRPLEPSRPYSTDEFQFSEVIPARMWLGEAPRRRDVKTLRDLGVTDIVNLTSLDEVQAVEREAAFNVHHYPFPDGFLGAHGSGELRRHARGMMQDACARLDELFQAGTRTYLHCVAGISRSPTVFMLWLIRTRRARTFREAYHLAHEARPLVSPNPELVEIMRELEPDAFPATSWR